MFPLLVEAIEALSIPLDGQALTAVVALRDRLEARIAEAVGEFDKASLWDIDAATSMTAWLRSKAEMTRRDAVRLAGHAERLRALPVTAAAWRLGELSSGQIDIVLGGVGDRHLERFADHETALVPTLAALGVQELAGVMATWRAKADAVIDEGELPQRQRSLHLSSTLGGQWELSGSLDPVGGEVVATALRLASTDDVEAEPTRTPAERRADSLVDVCRHFLDHQHRKAAGRHRPHLNVVINLDDLCSRHHHRLHMPGWHAKLRPDAELEITAPDGRHWATHPPGTAAPLLM